jgi:hypothetical protein
MTRVRSTDLLGSGEENVDIYFVMKDLPSSHMWRRVALARTTPRPVPEDGILHSHRRENLKS